MIQRPLNLLLIDDDEDDYVLLKEIISEIRGHHWTLTWASSFERGKSALLSGQFDLSFLDFRLGVQTGLQLLKEVSQAGCSTPIILLTGYGEAEVDVEAMKTGAADYLVKDQINSVLLERSIRYSIHRAETFQALKEREAQVLMQDRLASVGLLASSLAHEIGTPLGVIRGRAPPPAVQQRSAPPPAVQGNDKNHNDNDK